MQMFLSNLINEINTRNINNDALLETVLFKVAQIGLESFIPASKNGCIANYY